MADDTPKPETFHLSELSFRDNFSQVNDIQSVEREILKPRNADWPRFYPGRIEFEFESKSTAWLSPVFTLKVRARIVKDDKATPIEHADVPDLPPQSGEDALVYLERYRKHVKKTAGDTVTIVNGGGGSIFGSYTLKLANQEIEIENHFPYRHHIQRICELEKEDLEMIDESELFALDDPISIDQTSTAVPVERAGVPPMPYNKSYHGRFRRTKDSREFDIQLALPFMCFQSGRLLPPSTRVSIGLDHAPDRFRLHAADNTKRYYLEIRDISLHITQKYLNPDIFNSLSHFLQKESLFYAFRRVFLTGPYMIPPASDEYTLALGHAQLPLTLGLFLIPSKFYINADIGNNPYHFVQQELREVNLFFGGVKLPMIRQLYKLNNFNVSRLDAYENFVRMTQLIRNSNAKHHPIYTLEHFSHQPIYNVETHCQTSLPHNVSVTQTRGDLRLHLHFSPSSGRETLHLMLFHVYDESLTIRQVNSGGAGVIPEYVYKLSYTPGCLKY